MVRPKEFENLTATTIKVENDVLEKAKRMFNVSEICREALAKAINEPERIDEYNKKNKIKGKLKGIPKKFIRKAENFIVEDPTVASRWAEVANQRYNKSINSQDLLDFVCYK